MISFSKTYRSSQEEIMDDFTLKGDELKKLLTDLQRVNKWLGGNNITKDGIKQLIRDTPKEKTITILDVGCGDGELIRYCSKWGRKLNRNFEFIGVDANSYIINEAIERSHHYKNCTFKQVDIFSKTEQLPHFDIALCTLFLHHFKNQEIQSILDNLMSRATIGVVINDLHRNRWAFELFKVFSFFVIKTKIAKHDGLVSVARSFTKKELVDISEDIKAQHQIKWRWAFRWQWLIQKNT